jgi:hypothetical protein
VTDDWSREFEKACYLVQRTVEGRSRMEQFLVAKRHCAL